MHVPAPGDLLGYKTLPPASESFAHGTANNSFNVHAYCLMPDHLLAEGIEPTSDPLHVVRILKIESNRQYVAQPEGVLWQKRFYDRVVRSLESVEPVAWYIWLNPVRKVLVERALEYAFAGSCTGGRCQRHGVGSIGVHHGRDGTAPILDLKTRRRGRSP
jgi:REP element-mobilizing transposase RayT